MKKLVVVLGAALAAAITSGCRQAQDPTAQIMQQQQQQMDNQVASARTELDNAMKSWVGCRKADLLRVWGAPTSAFDEGDGTTIYTYEIPKIIPAPTLDLPPIQTSVTRVFFLNQDGIVTDYNWRGL